MISRVRNFFSRHRGKFLFTGGVIGGLYLLSHYAQRRLLLWHDNETQKLVEKQKRKQHYEGTKQTAIATVLSMSSAITKMLNEELNDGSLIKDIREHPERKQLLWDQLKIVGFSRCISSIFASSLVSLVVHSHLMILGAYTYADSKKKNIADQEISPRLQQRYLENIQFFVEEGLPLLVKRIYKATSIVVRNINLSQKLTLEQLEGLLKDIVLVLSGDTLIDSEHNCNVSLKLSPWSQYVFKTGYLNCEVEVDNLYEKLIVETSDILDSVDFHSLMDKDVNLGLNHLLDYLVNQYPEPVIQEIPFKNDIGVHVNQMNGDCDMKPNVQDCATKLNGYDGFPSESPLDIDSSEKCINNHSINQNDSNSSNCSQRDLNIFPSYILPPNSNLLLKSSLPVPKLIPILSGIIFPILSPAPAQFLQAVLHSDSLDKFSYNIYEAFSL